MTAVQMTAVLPVAKPAGAPARPSDGEAFARHLESAAIPGNTSEGGEGSSPSGTSGTAHASDGSAQEQETADAPLTLPGMSLPAGTADGEPAESSTELGQDIVGEDGGSGARNGDAAAEATPSAPEPEPAHPSDHAAPDDAIAQAALAPAVPVVSTEQPARTSAAPGSTMASTTEPGVHAPSTGTAAPAQQAPAVVTPASAGLVAPGQGQHAVPSTEVPTAAVSAAHRASGQETQARTDGVAVTTPAPVATTATSPAAPAAPPPAPHPPLAPQLAPQLAHLRQLPQGEHVLTLTVTPDTFGPVKVVAHITAEGTTVQLLGSTEAGREALRAALADLRRDLAATGLDARLDVDSGRGEAGSPDGRGPQAGSRSTSGTVHGGQGEPTALTSTSAPAADRSHGVDLFL